MLRIREWNNISFIKEKEPYESESNEYICRFFNLLALSCFFICHPQERKASYFIFFLSIFVISFLINIFIVLFRSIYDGTEFLWIVIERSFIFWSEFLSNNNRLLWFRLFRSVSFMGTLSSSTSRYNHALLQPLFLICALVCL